MRIPLPAVRKKARIEIIPLIDIVFFLLATFVMVSLSMVKNQGILVRLPAARTASAEVRKLTATISLTEDGKLYLDKQKVSREELNRLLGELKAQNPDLRVFINGAEKAMFGEAIGILDDVRGLGIEKVSIQTRSKDL